MDLGGDLAGYLRQGIPLEIHLQVPMAPLRPRLPGAISHEQRLTEKDDVGGHRGRYPPIIQTPLIKRGLALDTGMVQYGYNIYVALINIFIRVRKVFIFYYY